MHTAAQLDEMALRDIREHMEELRSARGKLIAGRELFPPEFIRSNVDIIDRRLREWAESIAEIEHRLSATGGVHEET